MNVDDLVTFTDTPDLTDHPGRVIVTIPSHLTTVEELYAFYGSVLGRDGYFGRNSPAFVDCLTDPGWHARPWREIVVWHPSLPRLGKRALGQYFLDVLFALRRMHERSGVSLPGASSPPALEPQWPALAGHHRLSEDTRRIPEAGT